VEEDSIDESIPLLSSSPRSDGGVEGVGEDNGFLDCDSSVVEEWARYPGRRNSVELY